jgi:four helix bundle protein
MSAARYDLEDRLVRFAVAVCRLAERLPTTATSKQIALQIVRSSTSSFANYGEVQGAESRRDFIHKLGICLKELRETRVWLKFIAEMQISTREHLGVVMQECEQLLAIVATSIRTARLNGRSRM